MKRNFLPSLRETYTDQHSLVERDATSARMLEEYRALYTAALARTAGNGGVVLGVSSPLAREGKTTVATNIAGAMASDLEKRVLLVSGVLRPADGAPTNREGVRPGLAEYVADPEKGLQEFLVHTPLTNLDVLFAGMCPENPSRLVRSERMRQAIATFRATFDITVMDLPPVLSASDSQVMASLMDGVLLVVSLNETPMDAVQRAVQVLGDKRLVGIAANRAEPTLPRWASRMLGGSEWGA